MEPVTHVLTGACLARSAFSRRVAYATAAMAVAAEFPDIDTVWSLRGPIAGFEHHRGITHTFLGLPFEAALLLGGFVLYHRWRTRHLTDRSRSPAGVPVRWGALYGLLLLALLSHLLLDFTNNYGLRPFYPFDSHWYAASLVFIFDPLLFVLLTGGLLAPALFSLIGSEISGKRERHGVAGWARAALTGVVLLWSLRAVTHGRALDLARQQTLRSPADLATGQEAAESQEPAPDPPRRLLRVQRAIASPDPLNPFRWYTAADFGPAYVLSTADVTRASIESDRELDKQQPDHWVRAAEQSHLGRVYMDWSAMPWITGENLTGPGGGTTRGAEPVVRFRDLRFMGGSRLMRRGSEPPLSGQVVFAPDGSVVEQSLDGREGH